ncbi:efflux RND transporter periplasmic adaptor subunit [Aminithiophilus ramosus]|uniref:Efflux RND transporter periplasmic adaptor subunit n=2 Tax=Synergistales TaxID=649776 RepID=A0A9Q7AJM5_9BACT|nr:efflux RND transporter periplasmic adaptor subunit [Aminithiophilus ramosus]QTX32855.1 efflux RND transporter periplasmic adaptor subunit [Aminithiophilus ramosus]QVL36730.1 efflux RND transporter periplasmic adaptor subunit [Synergistota bacterium]
MKRLLVLLAFVALFVGLILFRGLQERRLAGEPEESPLPVDVTKVEERLFREIVSFVADIEATERAAVVAKLPGRTVLSVAVDVGDVVRRGDLLATLDDSLLASGLAQAEATLAQASAALRRASVQEERARLDFERFARLLEEEVISRQRYDHAKGDYEASAAMREEAEKAQARARAALEELRTQMGYHRIESPIDGVVARRDIDPGDSSNLSGPAFVINRQHEVKVRGAVDEKAFVRIARGQRATLSVDALGEAVFEGVVSRLSPALEGATRTGEVEIVLDDGGGRLRPGLFARVRLFLGERRGEALPREALFRLEGTGERACYVADGGRARLRLVETGLEEGDWVEIVGGLSREEAVVMTRSGSLRDGTLLEVSRR